MSRILVLGANGFIGKHLVRKLAQDKNSSICAFDRFPEYSTGQNVQFADLENVKIFQGDFLNRDDISEALDDTEYVFHFVSTTNPAISMKDPYIDVDTNLRASISLFELCAQKGVKRVIFPSSGGTVYGNTLNETMDESTLPQPISPYGIGKLAIEHYLRYFNITHGLDYIVFRIANPYGPGQNVHGKQGVIPIFLHAALNHSVLNVYGDGSMIRDYLYIDDLIDMIAATYNQQHRYDTYNLGSGTGSSINDILSSIEKCTTSELTVSHQPVPPTFVNKSILDINRFMNEFNVKPRISIETGISKTWSYLRDNNSPL